MQYIYFPEDDPLEDYYLELREEVRRLGRERRKKRVAKDAIADEIINQCQFEEGQKVRLTGRYADEMKGDYVFIYHLYLKVVDDEVMVWVKLCNPLKSDGTIPKATHRKGLDNTYSIEVIEAV